MVISLARYNELKESASLGDDDPDEIEDDEEKDLHVQDIEDDRAALPEE